MASTHIAESAHTRNRAIVTRPFSLALAEGYGVGSGDETMRQVAHRPGGTHPIGVWPIQPLTANFILLALRSKNGAQAILSRDNIRPMKSRYSNVVP